MPRYNDKILLYYNNNNQVGSFNENSKNVGTGLVGSPSCGDVMKLQIKVKKDPHTNIKKIADAKILVFGCGSAKASSSYVAEQLIGKKIEDAMKIKNTEIAKYLDLPKIKLHCSVLAENAIKRAVDDYLSKNNIQKKVNKKDNNSLKTDDIDIKNINKKITKNNTANKKFKLFATKIAINFIKKHLSKTKKNIKIKGIQLSLEEGHCGLGYKVRYITNNENCKNYICYTIDGLNFFVKKNETEILNGTRIDFKEEGLKRGLIFKNQHETGRCNCGLNFFTKKTKEKSKNCKK